MNSEGSISNLSSQSQATARELTIKDGILAAPKVHLALRRKLERLELALASEVWQFEVLALHGQEEAREDGLPARVLLVDDLEPLRPSRDDEVVESRADSIWKNEDRGVEDSAGIWATRQLPPPPHRKPAERRTGIDERNEAVWITEPLENLGLVLPSVQSSRSIDDGARGS